MSNSIVGFDRHTSGCKGSELFLFFIMCFCYSATFIPEELVVKKYCSYFVQDYFLVVSVGVFSVSVELF